MISETRQIETDALYHAADAPMLDQVQAWANIGSGSQNADGLAAMASVLADAFAALPGDILLREPEQDKAQGRNLHLVVRPQAPVQVLLTGHMDTVYGPESPFRQVGMMTAERTLNGPGVADMKGGLALMLAALRAVETSPAAARIGYEVVINSDEEIGSPGSAALIARAACGKRAALTYEPAILPDGTLAGARPGSGNFAIIVSGRSAHAGRNPQEGRNAVVAAADLAVLLARAMREGLAINPARIEGGGPNNVVPDRAVLHVNLRPATALDETEARQLIDETVARIAALHDVSITVNGGFGRPPKALDAGAVRLFELVRSCGADLGQAITWRPTGGVCDGNNIAACGVPVVDTMGARGGAIHSPDEYLIVDSLVERAQLSTLVLLRLAQGGLS